MKRFTIAAALVVAALPLAAQVRTPRASQKQTVTQTVGITDVTITYSRPAVRGRAIWGSLVPYDKVWRTGANEATTIAFSDDVTVNGQKLAKGTYSFHTIPGRDQWTLVFNKVADQWGSFQYNQQADALRVTAKPEKSDGFRELLTFEFPRVTADEATVAIRWENLSVPFTINSDTVNRTLTSFRGALGPDWRTPFQAAQFAFENNVADADVQTWLDRSLAVQQNLNNLWLKARMQAKAGNVAEARKTAEMAIAKATPQQSDFVDEIRRQMGEWK